MVRGGVRSAVRGSAKDGGETSEPTPTSLPGSEFDGTHDHLQSNSSFTIISPLLLARLSVRIDGGDGSSRIIASALTNTILIGLNSDNKFQINVSADPDLDPTLIAESASTYLAGSDWINLLIAIDTDAAAGSKTVQLYVNDQDDLGAVVDDGAAFDIDNPSKINIGSYDFDAGLWHGAMAGLWIGLGQYLDLSVVGNRRQFIDADGKPYVNLGAYGQGPTGTSPTIYLNNSYTSFASNKGTSGDLRTFGALVDAGDSPND